MVTGGSAGHLDQVHELVVHHARLGDRAIQHSLIDQRVHQGRMFAVQHGLAGQAAKDQPVNLVLAGIRLCGQYRPGVRLGLQQPGDERVLEGPQRLRLGLVLGERGEARRVDRPGHHLLDALEGPRKPEHLVKDLGGFRLRFQRHRLDRRDGRRGVVGPGRQLVLSPPACLALGFQLTGEQGCDRSVVLALAGHVLTDPQWFAGILRIGAATRTDGRFPWGNRTSRRHDRECIPGGPGGVREPAGDAPPGGRAAVRGTAMMTARSLCRVYRGELAEVARVRRDLAVCLRGVPRADDVVLAASELAANCVVHARSRMFIIRCEIFPGAYVRVEAQDAGADWQERPPGDRPHGMDLIQALAVEWGTGRIIGGDRVTWARLAW